MLCRGTNICRILAVLVLWHGLYRDDGNELASDRKSNLSPLLLRTPAIKTSCKHYSSSVVPRAAAHVDCSYAAAACALAHLRPQTRSL